ncbi:PepSY domain-containing protein [Parasedimentitalea denitrificans]|nr:PepSY domain-containing protein [Sedimentitalea sp. CY04]
MKLQSLTLASAMIFTGAVSQAAVVAGDSVGTTVAEVRSALEGAGYVIESVEVNADEIEAEVTLDGAFFEIEISSATGIILEVEAENENGSDTD